MSRLQAHATPGPSGSRPAPRDRAAAGARGRAASRARRRRHSRTTPGINPPRDQPLETHEPHATSNSTSVPRFHRVTARAGGVDEHNRRELAVGQRAIARFSGAAPKHRRAACGGDGVGKQRTLWRCIPSGARDERREGAGETRARGNHAKAGGTQRRWEGFRREHVKR